MPTPQTLDENYVRDFVTGCRDEANSTKTDRMDANRDNFAMYHLRHDFTHKTSGQSKEVLARVRNATEQTKAFFQQSLADLDAWFRIEAKSGEATLITTEEAQKLLNFMLGKADYFSHVGNSVQSGLLGSLSISMVGGEMVVKPKFKTRAEGKGKNYKKNVIMVEDKSWELRFYIVRQENYYPDPYKQNGMYKVIDDYMDLYEVQALAEGDDAIYDKSAVDDLKGFGVNDENKSDKRIETGQNNPQGGVRPRVKLTHFWGTIVDKTTGKILAENVTCTLANDTTVIRKPTDNPLWHQKQPYVAAALIEVANSVWGVALMDAGTKHNRSLNEIFNLMLDSAMKSVWGVNQIRVDALEDPKQLEGGIPWGTHLKVNASLPVGGKVMEQVVTGDLPPEVITMFNLLGQETNTSMMSSDLRQGQVSNPNMKATAVVASENTITGVFQGMAKNFESKKIQPELELAWMTLAQNWDLIDPEVFVSLFGAERGTAMSQMEPQEVFAQTVNGFKFSVFGISLALRRQADFRKWTTLLQVIGGSEVLVEAFLSKYSFEKFLGEIMTAIDVDKSKIENAQPPAPAQGAAPGGAPLPPEAAALEAGGAPGANPNTQSQVPSPAGIPAQANPLSAIFQQASMNAPA